MADPRANWGLVSDLGSSLKYGGSALGNVPALLREVLETEAWRDFVTPRGNPVHHDRFAEFVTVPPTEGLGASVDLIRRVVANDPKTLDLLDQALQNPVGGSNKINLNDDDSNNENDLVRPSGTSKDYALRRLRKDAPELHAEVLAGNLSAHAAMVKAGFRPKTFTVRPDPASAARTLRRHMPPDALRSLARLLTDEEGA